MRTYLIQLTDIECGQCGLIFSVPEDWLADRQRDGNSFYCPNGHGRVFRDTEAKRLAREVESLRSTNGYLRNARDHADEARFKAERSRAATKGQLTKVRKRIANGVCPCCRRTFANLHRHMSSQHPDFPTAAAAVADHEGSGG